MTSPNDSANPADLTDPRVARRDKLRRLEELGIDPWGSRFDDRVLIGEVRNRAGEVKYVLQDGRSLDLPEFGGEPPVDYRQWKAAQGLAKKLVPKSGSLGASSCCVIPVN